jgi:hypothetical protein
LKFTCCEVHCVKLAILTSSESFDLDSEFGDSFPFYVSIQVPYTHHYSPCTSFLPSIWTINTTCFPHSLLSFSLSFQQLYVPFSPHISCFSFPHFLSLQPHDSPLLHFDSESVVSLPITFASHTITFSHPFAIYLHVSAYHWQPFQISAISVSLQSHSSLSQFSFSKFQFHTCISLFSPLHFSGFSFVPTPQTVLISRLDSVFPSHDKHQSPLIPCYCATVIFHEGDGTDLLKQRKNNCWQFYDLTVVQEESKLSNILAGYEDEEGADIRLHHSSSSFGSEDDLPWSTDSTLQCLHLISAPKLRPHSHHLFHSPQAPHGQLKHPERHYQCHGLSQLPTPETAGYTNNDTTHSGTSHDVSLMSHQI